MIAITLTRTRTVATNVHVSGVYVSGDPDDLDATREHLFVLDATVLEDMGNPEKITVTIEPGDKLNEV